NPTEALRHRSDTTPTFILQTKDLSFYVFLVLTVTTVDSGYKALEFLGLRQGIESNDSIALSSSPQSFPIPQKCPQLSSGHPRLLVIQLNPSSMIHS
ncbi:unnamed protein product, partial [Brassica oleracea]